LRGDGREGCGDTTNVGRGIAAAVTVRAWCTSDTGNFQRQQAEPCSETRRVRARPRNGGRASPMYRIRRTTGRADRRARAFIIRDPPPWLRVALAAPTGRRSRGVGPAIKGRRPTRWSRAQTDRAKPLAAFWPRYDALAARTATRHGWTTRRTVVYVAAEGASNDIQRNLEAPVGRSRAERNGWACRGRGNPRRMVRTGYAAERAGSKCADARPTTLSSRTPDSCTFC